MYNNPKTKNNITLYHNKTKTKIKKNIVLISSPHTFCVSKNVRDCDKIARIASKCLKKHLSDLNLNPILKLNDNLFRFECDLNRYKCRNTNFRKNLKKTFKKYKKFILIHIDIHSFPNMLTNHKTYNQDIYFIDDSKNNIPLYTLRLMRYLENEMIIFYNLKLKQYIDLNKTQIMSEEEIYLRTKLSNLNYKIFLGPIYGTNYYVQNDIQDEARIQHGLKTILIEFNESIRNYALDQLCKLISKWIHENL